MPPPPHSKPENVLKRAQELIGVGQQQAALSLLHEHVTSKRTRNSPISSLEPVMILFVELCVDLRKGKLAKDGLYQYKNTAQNTNVGTIELVFKHFIELAEKKVTEAQTKAEEVQSSLEPKEAKEGEDAEEKDGEVAEKKEKDAAAPTAGIEDLEASETPESILLSTVSGEQSKDRTDRAIVTPWLKFLWETYRTVLDIFKNNARLEVMYQSTTHQAFQFCSKYARKTEFRRLCELLRNHLQNAAKFSSQVHAINLSDPDTLQRHLDTRFQQLNVAVELELWQEAFRSIEDIHTLLSLSKRPAKNIMMANYFEKLTRIFLVSDNYLFHASAWSRYYNLLRQSAAAVASGQGSRKDNPAVTEADMTKAASYVILSALSIPVISTSRSRGALVDVDEARKNKNVRLTNLLGMSQSPSRAMLLRDGINKGLLRRVRPEIRELYNILEVDFHPLSICKKISPILSQIGADPEMQKYVLPLQEVILTRLFQQLSQVYESVELKFVLDLAQFPEPFQITGSKIEKFIMNGCKKGDLAIRVDHATGILTFDSDVFSSARAVQPGGAGSAESEVASVQRLQSTPAEIVRSQLTRLAKSLYITCQYVDPSFNADKQKAKAAALQRAAAGAEQEHLDILARKEIIDKRKQAASTALAQKEKEEANKKRLRAVQAQEAERERLAQEQRDREAKRLKDEQMRVKREEITKQLEELKTGTKTDIDLENLDLDEYDTQRIRAMKLAALEKEKNELADKLRTSFRRFDHLERAYRREEIKHLPKDYDEQRERDLAAYEKSKSTTLREAEEKHTEELALKHRLSRLLPTYETFKNQITQQRRQEFEKRRKEAERDLNKKMQARIAEVKARRAEEKRRAEQEERERREEEERIAAEEEERARVEEEKRAKLAEEKARRDEERKRLDEKAALQRQKEAEAEAKLQAKKSGQRIPERPAAQPMDERSDSNRGPPRIPVPGGKPSWREREAAKAAGQPLESATAAVTPEAPPADVPTTEAQLPKRTGPAPGKFVPPALRGEGGGGGWREREKSKAGSTRDESPAAPPAAGGSGRWQPRGAFRDREPSGAGGFRDRETSGSGGFRDREMSRDGDRGDRGARSGSGYRPPHMKRADGERDGAGEGESMPPPPPQQATAGGRYVPGAFKRRGEGQ